MEVQYNYMSFFTKPYKMSFSKRQSKSEGNKNSSSRMFLACVAGGISRASAFVLVAKPWTRVAKPWEDWWRVELNFSHAQIRYNISERLYVHNRALGSCRLAPKWLQSKTFENIRKNIFSLTCQHRQEKKNMQPRLKKQYSKTLCYQARFNYKLVLVCWKLSCLELQRWVFFF